MTNFTFAISYTANETLLSKPWVWKEKEKYVGTMNGLKFKVDKMKSCGIKGIVVTMIRGGKSNAESRVPVRNPRIW